MLLDMLNELAVVALRNISFLNCGGCAVFAHLVGQELHKLNIPYFGIVAEEDHHDLDQLREEIDNTYSKRGWNDAGLYFMHVGVGFHLDNVLYHYESLEGAKEADGTLCDLIVCDGILIPEELEAIALEARGWNPWFDRGQIPTLKKIIKQHFEMIEVPCIT